jgi:hypothetical protein
VQCEVNFPAQWVNASKLETALRNSCGPHGAGSFEVSFEFPTSCKVMVDDSDPASCAREPTGVHDAACPFEF